MLHVWENRHALTQSYRLKLTNDSVCLKDEYQKLEEKNTPDVEQRWPLNRCDSLDVSTYLETELTLLDLTLPVKQVWLFTVPVMAGQLVSQTAPPLAVRICLQSGGMYAAGRGSSCGWVMFVQANGY